MKITVSMTHAMPCDPVELGRLSTSYHSVFEVISAVVPLRATPNGDLTYHPVSNMPRCTNMLVTIVRRGLAELQFAERETRSLGRPRVFKRLSKIVFGGLVVLRSIVIHAAIRCLTASHPALCRDVRGTAVFHLHGERWCRTRAYSWWCSSTRDLRQPLGVLPHGGGS